MLRNIKLAEDLLAPAAVSAVDIITLETVPQYNNWASYIMTGLGYFGAVMGWGPFVKNIGVASLPLTARHVYQYVKTQGGVGRRAGSRMALNPVNARPPSPVSRVYQEEFEAAGSHAF